MGARSNAASRQNQARRRVESRCLQRRDHELRTRRSTAIFALFFALWSLVTVQLWTGEAVAQPVEAAPRPATWAQPVEIEGAPKLHRVAENFFRSAQPTA